MLTNLSQKSPSFFCEYCEYITDNKKDFDKHKTTLKHSKLTSVNKSLTKNPTHTENTTIFSCQKCSKEYKSRVGLWKHNQKCKTNTTDIIPNEPSDNDLIMLLIKENSELKTLMLEQSNMVMKVLENGTHTNNSHNTTNSHNKAFNLNFFLNETCKDAMNIMDFVDSIKLQLNDLEKVGEIGYVEGISNIITTNLKALDITQRPIHCTDKKRDVLYVKDEDKWEKEAENKNKLRKAIKKIASKNQRLIPDYKIKHPDCGKAASKFSDQYNKIIVESMGGSGDNDDEKEDKIIKNISKATIIDKTEELI